MNIRKITALLGGLMFLMPVAAAQMRVHSDGRGYTYRSSSGNYTYMHRYDTGATYQRLGSYATYYDDSGTSGYSCYWPNGRYDSFTNEREGWSGSGYTPYASPGLTTYTRTSSRNHDAEDTAWAWTAGLGGLGLGTYGLRRWRATVR